MNLKRTNLITIAVSMGIFTVSVGAHAQDPVSNDPQVVQDNTADMAARVKQALEADPALLDRHIDVATKDGRVVMKGFVETTEDIQRAVSTANETVGAENVVSELKIKPSN
jgi:osmotically-inducible protein OsmY